MSYLQGRGNAFIAAVALVVCTVALLNCEVAEAKTFVVGGNQGWTFNVVSWTRGKKFKAGDTLVFKYNSAMHDVIIVDKTGYNTCTASASDKVFHSGSDSIKLVKGKNFFICGFSGHCAGGVKIAVTAH